jgi:hypothetical protein
MSFQLDSDKRIQIVSRYKIDIIYAFFCKICKDVFVLWYGEIYIHLLFLHDRVHN